MKESEKERIQKMNRDAYTLFFRILIILTIPAIVAAVTGKVIDNTFNTAPYGTLATLAVFNILTWIIILVFAKNFITDQHK